MQIFVHQKWSNMRGWGGMWNQPNKILQMPFVQGPQSMNIQINTVEAWLFNTYNIWLLCSSLINCSVWSRPDSEASTIPGTEEELKAMAIQRAKDVQAVQVTPPPKIKRSHTDASDTSQPKLSREVQSKKVLPTAVKAQGAPPIRAKIEQVEPAAKRTSQAVQECLRRPSTKDLASPSPTQPSNPPRKAMKTPTGKAAAPKVVQAPMPTASSAAPASKAASAPPPPDPTPPPSDDDYDSDEDRRLAELARAKREAHARYMRFSRSLSSGLV